MQKNVLLFLVVSLIWSCNAETKKTEAKATGYDQCYVAVSGKDTAELQFNLKDGQIDGILAYNYFEKDQSKGRVSGNWRNDTLIWDFDFFSEGTKSRSQVALLRKGDRLLEGYGEVTEDSLGLRFTHPEKLNFGDSFIFVKTKCK
jgi:hypothetical protein